MLKLYSETQVGKLVLNNQDIVFDNKVEQTGCTSTANVPTNTITLNKAGFYIVNFNEIVSNDDYVNEFLNITMQNNGVDAYSAHAGATSSSTSDIENIEFTTLVRVRPNCCAVGNTTRLQFNVTGFNVLVYFANVVVTKID